jgi:glucose/arabinose dehydrogenase
MPRLTTLALCLAAPLALAACAQSPRPADAPGNAATTPATPSPAPATSGQLRVDTLATGLEHPWSVALLPDGSFLVTERPGRLRRVSATGTLSAPIAGVPEVWARGQGGLLDVVLDPGFAGNQRIWLSYAEPGENGTAGTAVATGVLGEAALTDVRVVYRQVPKLDGGQHFGSRIVFDGQGHVFISHGDRGQKTMAQDLEVLQGKLVRLNVDGTQPADNPFAAGPGVRKAIWSYGHRNIQGMAQDPRTGTLWLSEHGPRGGDELNLPQAGRNYGWPVVSHGNDYVTNRPYPETRGTEAPGMEPPHHVWMKSPGLSGMAFLTGRPGHPWNDSLFQGALAERNLIRLQLDGNRIVSEERLLEDLGQRIRDVRVGPQGEVYVLTDDGNGRLLRLTAPAAR